MAPPPPPVSDIPPSPVTDMPSPATEEQQPFTQA